MQNPLIMKLSSFTDLDSTDRAVLEAICAKPARRSARVDLIREGDRPDDVHLLLSGWACRYSLTTRGARQIMAFMIPGDLCDSRIFILEAMDHSIGLLSDADVVSIPKAQMLELTARPAIARALWWSTLVDEATLRHWLVNLGQRSAVERLAHLFCELWVRMKVVGQAQDNAFELPVTQEELGDTLGLTSVHINRMLQELRGEGLIRLSGKRLIILDSDRLHKLSGFTPNYLHLKRRKAMGPGLDLAASA